MRDLTDRDLERLFELDDGTGPARPIDAPRAQAILAAALGRAGFSPPGGGHGGGGAGASAAARAGGRAKLAVLSGGAVVLAIAAVAWIATRSPSAPGSPSRAPASASAAPNSAAPPSTLPPDDPGSPSRAPASASAAPNSAAPPSTLPPVTDPPATEPPTAPPATEPPSAPPATASPTAEPSAPPPTAEPPTARSRTAPPAIAAPSPPHLPARTAPARAVGQRRLPRAQPAVAATLDDLLAQANAARAAHRWRAADALYAQVVTRVVADGPATLAVQTALVASASIHLEHFADPAGAARRFADALAAEPHGALAEEARWGLAEAARARADRVRELRALDDFLTHHPGSVLAAQARARRAALGAPP